MKWLIIIVVAGFLYYRFVLVKRGNLNFWKLAKNYPEDAYSFFTGDDSFVVLIVNRWMVFERICPLVNEMVHLDCMSLQETNSLLFLAEYRNIKSPKKHL